MPLEQRPVPSPSRPIHPTMSDHEFHAELWRALIIVVRAFIRKYGFKPPTFD
jgi:hypothetical protein